MNLENRPLSKNIRNVDENIRCVVLTPQLGIAQLYCEYTQTWGMGHYLAYVNSDDSEPTIRIMKFNKEVHEVFGEVSGDTTTLDHVLEPLSQDQCDIILPTLSEDLTEWLLNPRGKIRHTLAPFLRSTVYTVVQEHNLGVLDDLFRGKSIPKRLHNLMTNHRVGSRLLPDPFAEIKSLDGIDIIPSKVNIGERDIRSIEWLVFFSDGPAMFIPYRQGKDEQPIEKDNVVLAVQFIHDTTALETGWVQINVYR